MSVCLWRPDSLVFVPLVSVVRPVSLMWMNALRIPTYVKMVEPVLIHWVASGNVNTCIKLIFLGTTVAWRCLVSVKMTLYVWISLLLGFYLYFLKIVVKPIKKSLIRVFLYIYLISAWLHFFLICLPITQNSYLLYLDPRSYFCYTNDDLLVFDGVIQVSMSKWVYWWELWRALHSVLPVSM